MISTIKLLNLDWRALVSTIPWPTDIVVTVGRKHASSDVESVVCVRINFVHESKKNY